MQRVWSVLNAVLMHTQKNNICYVSAKYENIMVTWTKGN